MQFVSAIAGEPCLIKVTHYRPYVPMKGAFRPMEDAVEEIPAEFEYDVLRLDGTPWPELKDQVDDAAHYRLQIEYEAAVTAAKHGMDF